ncbi:MAG TPA: transposase [Polyangiaceae bacterium]|nr:transposase [Polyangiaceae bacterium]
MVEIIKPLDETWSDVGARMRALRKTLPLALNFALRDVFSRAMTQVEQVANGERADTRWQDDVRKRLRYHWEAQLTRQGAWVAKRSKAKAPMVSDRALAAPGDVLCSETSDYITSRFSGQHFKDLLAGRAGVPTFGGGKSFFSEGRHCSISGSPEKAELSFPLWGTGKRATRFAVAPCGDGHAALWRRLVESADHRVETIDLIKQSKQGDTRKQALLELETKRVLKMGRVGIKYNERKGKWFALISWTEYLPDLIEGGLAAACNFGINCFVAALAEDGSTYEDVGTDIIATRTRYQHRRRSLQRCVHHRGSGSRGRGVKRREKPLTDLGDAEARWVRDRIRRAAADFASWCVSHGVGVVYLEDLTGLRDSFERATSGTAHEEVKRWIHNWAFYETQCAFQRQLEESSIVVQRDKARFVSRRCPRKECGHTAAENVKCVGGDWVPVPDHTLQRLRGMDGEYRVTGGKLYQRQRKQNWFECVNCGFRADGDKVACANHLQDAGREQPLQKALSAARMVTRVETETASGSVLKASVVAAE